MTGDNRRPTITLQPLEEEEETFGEIEQEGQGSRQREYQREYQRTNETLNTGRLYITIQPFGEMTVKTQKNEHFETSAMLMSIECQFANLKRIVDPKNALPDDYQIRLFLNGLKPSLAAKIAKDPNYLDTAIRVARTAEVALQMEQLTLNYAKIVNVLAVQTGISNLKPLPS
ncbi:2165_t:CDS:2 [Funneliformis caledonium]|uniref:2165_t:CDS:1 n=1 Tax=Funneliformis caledonium TaxID=1117310 RepID=A0A9N8VN26_9GLOM|nr:2165_t:CDS:2 [Funneliformis caledonium]